MKIFIYWRFTTFASNYRPRLQNAKQMIEQLTHYKIEKKQRYVYNNKK